MEARLKEAVIRAANREDWPRENLLAVVEVESAGVAFERDGKTPRLLFERHVFFRELAKFPEKQQEAITQGLAHDGWRRATQYKDQGTSLSRLQLIERARAIDLEIANRSASWGVGQTMGFNAKSCGFDTATQMVSRMASIDAQVSAMVAEIKSKKNRNNLRLGLWEDFARIYNGKGFKQNSYDTRIEAAAVKWKKALDPLDPEDGSEVLFIPPTENIEAAPMSQSKISNGALTTGGLVTTGASTMVAERVLSKAADKAGAVTDKVIDGASNVVFTGPMIFATVCFLVALGACGYIVWQRFKLKRDAGV